MDRSRLRVGLLFSFFSLVAAVGGTQEISGSSSSGNTDCKVVIVGGGAAGMHTFYRLAPVYKKDVCLFEKNSYFGGRIKDIDSPNGKGKWAAGAVRVMDGQTVLFNLAGELGIMLEPADYIEPRAFARGVFHSNTNDFAGMGNPYPTVGVPDFPDYSCVGPANYPGCFNDAYYQQIFRPAAPAPGAKTIEAYAPTVIGAEEFQFVKDTFRFRGDFLSAIDARSYLDFLREDWDACCTPSYPVGGMSAFIYNMLGKAKLKGARAFASEPVLAINKYGSKYAIRTSKRTVTAEKIVIAVPPVAFKDMGGTIAEKIRNMNQFKDIKPIRVITVENWWKAPGWWTTLSGDGGNGIDRAWATPENFKFNFAETFHSPYQKKQLAVRTVYNDDPRTTQLWADAYASGGENAINTMIVNQLNQFFNFSKIKQSDIVKTQFQDWPDAWYWLKKGTSFTNADLAIWAVKPLQGENISLASDAYNPNRTTWSDGAYKSSINTLNKNFGLGLKCASVVPDGSGLKYVPFNSPDYDCPDTTVVASKNSAAKVAKKTPTKRMMH